MANKNAKLQLKIYAFGVAVALVLALADTALSADANQAAEYGPQPPAGFIAKAEEKVSSWWNAVKARVANFKNSLAPVEGSIATTEQAMGKAEARTGVALEYKLSLKSVQGVEGSVHSQPALILSKSGQSYSAFPIPSFTPRPKKTLPAEAVALPVAAEIKKHERYNLASVPGEVSLPKAMERKVLALLAYSGKQLENIEILSDDSFKMIRALFSWLWSRGDEAAKALHSLGTGSKNALVREKSLAFAGWILSEKKFDAFASLAFWRALESSTANDASADFDNAIAWTLSELVSNTTLAKAWGDTHRGVAEKLINAGQLKGDAASFMSLVAAEQAFDKHSYGTARKHAQAIPAKSRWKEHGRYLAATSSFAQGGGKDSKEALNTAGRELTELFRTVENTDVFDATAVTLGRIHFALGNYKAANKYLTQVSRETNMYIEATVDNAWALLRSGDRNGAVGNMFTLHTPFFEGAYMPDSYFLKSLGYQEICQFGDAMNAVKQYKQHYNAAFKGLLDFNSKGKAQDAAYYEDLTNYLSKREFKLPPIVLRELGRHPQFLRRQKILNNLAREERTLAQALPLASTALVAWENVPAEKVRVSLKKEIASFFKGRALAMEEELKFVTANMSLLEYEIYAGAGQNLAMQGAKNFAVDEKKAVAKAEFQADKEYWPYEDEIWEDELNNFRSKMVDACAKARAPAAENPQDKDS